MWARMIQLMIGVWLLISPFIFPALIGRQTSMAPELLFGAVFVLLAMLGCMQRFAIAANTLSFFFAGALTLFAYFSVSGELPPVEQNRLICGILIAMFAIIPLDTINPPQKIQPQVRNLQRQSRSS